MLMPRPAKKRSDLTLSANPAVLVPSPRISRGVTGNGVGDSPVKSTKLIGS
jgi:hypothetical protein